MCDAYLNNNQETGYSSTSEEDLIAKELEMLIDELVGGMPEQRRMIIHWVVTKDYPMPKLPNAWILPKEMLKAS